MPRASRERGRMTSKVKASQQRGCPGRAFQCTKALYPKAREKDHRDNQDPKHNTLACAKAVDHKDHTLARAKVMVWPILVA